jgi:hypothetical protein
MSDRRPAVEVLPETKSGAIIKALAILAVESHAEAEPDQLDHWRAAAHSARMEYDRLTDALRASRAVPPAEQTEYAPGETVMNLYDGARARGFREGVEAAARLCDATSDIVGGSAFAARLRSLAPGTEEKP